MVPAAHPRPKIPQVPPPPSAVKFRDLRISLAHSVSITFFTNVVEILMLRPKMCFMTVMCIYIAVPKMKTENETVTDTRF